MIRKAILSRFDICGGVDALDRHEKRLNWQEEKKFRDAKYAGEELVAELGAAFICAGLRINIVEKGNTAAYIDRWQKVLRGQ